MGTGTRPRCTLRGRWGGPGLLVIGSCRPGHGQSWLPQAGLRAAREVWGCPGNPPPVLGDPEVTSRASVCVGLTSKKETSRDPEEPTFWAVRDGLGAGPPLTPSPANYSSGPRGRAPAPSSAASFILTALPSSGHYHYLRLTHGDTEAQRDFFLGTCSRSLSGQ